MKQYVVDAFSDKVFEGNPVAVCVMDKWPEDAYDFVCRTFFPKIRINEDPVCGSAHCNLVPFWAEKLGKDELTAHQISARGGVIYCWNAKDRVYLSGKAVLYSESEIHV